MMKTSELNGRHPRPPSLCPSTASNPSLWLDKFHTPSRADPDPLAPGIGPGLRPQDNQHFLSGMTLTEQGRMSEAIAELDQAIRFDPQLAQAYHDRGNADLDLAQ